MTILIANHSHIQAIQQIYAPYCAEDCYISFEYEAPGVDEMKSRMDACFPKFPFLVYVQNDQVLGYAYAGSHSSRAAYDWSCNVSIYLDEKAKGKGVGRKLYTCLFSILKELGYYNLYAGITLPNAASEGIHRAMGFAQIAVYEKVGYKSGAWRDVLWLRLALREHTDNPPPQPVQTFEQYLTSCQKAFATTDGCLWEYTGIQTS